MSLTYAEFERLADVVDDEAWDTPKDSETAPKPFIPAPEDLPVGFTTLSEGDLPESIPPRLRGVEGVVGLKLYTGKRWSRDVLAKTVDDHEALYYITIPLTWKVSVHRGSSTSAPFMMGLRRSPMRKWTLTMAGTSGWTTQLKKTPNSNWFSLAKTFTAFDGKTLLTWEITAWFGRSWVCKVQETGEVVAYFHAAPVMQKALRGTLFVGNRHKHNLVLLLATLSACDADRRDS